MANAQCLMLDLNFELYISMSFQSCKDCRYFLPVDVFSGLCKMNKQKITQEDPSCEQGEKIAKCKFCMHFTADSEFLGKCKGATLAYPDMIAAQCADFAWIRPN